MLAAMKPSYSICMVSERAVYIIEQVVSMSMVDKTWFSCHGLHFD